MRFGRNVLSWALYDWANSAFATTVMAGFFPVFFRQYWNTGVETTVGTFRLGAANSIAGLIVVALAPVIGAVADRGGARKKFLAFFAVMGIVMTGGMFFVAKGDWLTAAALYIMGILGFSLGNVTYDSLLLSVARPEESDMVSALGFSLGYLGGGLLFALNVLMTLKPALFHLADSAQAVRWSFLTVAVWWAVFSIPVMIWVREPDVVHRRGGGRMVTAGFRQLASTFGRVRRLKVVMLFLLAYWLYIDGVDTAIRMAVDYGMSLGFDSKSLILALLITQFVGFPAAIAFGRIGEKLGTRAGILIAIVVYIAVTVWAVFMSHVREFYILAVTVGLVQGGVQSLSRSFYSRIIPSTLAGEFFGFYNMLGKFATVIGPLLMGWVGMLTGSPRLALLSIVVLFICGGTLLWFVDEQEGTRKARELDENSVAAGKG